ncbi:DUF4136 domain-containing protein [Sphingomonas sp. LT1P40]|uniref:DUF4136 domain-containing protein n=1 Tax=Alteristakelama amylovorans TaxID=3096166 RepID=UPI002FC8C8F3
MKTRALLTLAATAALMAGCATSGGRGAPVDVTRYHLAQPIPAGAVSIQPKDSVAGPEYQLYADAVGSQMAVLGFSPAAAGTSADYIATVDFSRTDRGQVRTRPPVTIGLGGGGFGGNVGGGVGASVGLGGKTRTVYGSELAVQLRRRGDNTVIWEGKAITESLGDAPGSQPTDTATKLAAALFKGFPGQSGITITVK